MKGPSLVLYFDFSLSADSSWKLKPLELLNRVMVPASQNGGELGHFRAKPVNRQLF